MDVVETEQPVSTIISDAAFFAYKNREDSLKVRIIAALKYKDEQSSGIVQQSVEFYGQPLWDESESVTVDSAVRILVPMYDSLAKDIVGLWCFDNCLDSDTVYYGMSAAPLALSDTAFALDLNLLYDYFRFKLGLPTERKNVRFEIQENNNIGAASSGDIRPNMIVSICSTMCGYVSVGDGEWVEKGCITTCEYYSMPTYYYVESVYIGDFDSGGGGGGSGNNNNSNNNQTSTYTITVSATTGGMATGGGTFPGGKLISISAQAMKEDYVFEHWMLNGSVVSTDHTYALTVSQNQTYVAKFITKDCYKAKQMAQDAILNGAANLLKGEAQTKSNEVARFGAFYNGMNTTGSREGITGEAGFPNLNGGTYNWMFHSHPSGAGIIFSGRDLMSLYQIYAGHLYTNLSSFLFGVVNHLGSGYALAITDPFLFEQFAQEYRLGSGNPEYIMKMIDDKISLYNVSEAEKRFTKFINGSGLSLWKVDNIRYSQNTWDAVKYNTKTKRITTQPCD
ncbi:MAG: hypothetical protein LBF69_06395 [Prevotellaceae bacterium]|nr:hypothetical protein [Prevotellaceae bacterium]